MSMSTVSRTPIPRKSTMDQTIEEGLNFLNSGCRNYAPESDINPHERITGAKRPRTRSLSPKPKSPKRKSPEKKSSSPKKSPSPRKKSPTPKKAAPPRSSPVKKSTPVKTSTPVEISTPIDKSVLSPDALRAARKTELENFRSERTMKSTGADLERLTEIIFSFDTTGSMGAAIDLAKKNIEEITSRLFESVSNLRIGIIGHGDYCDPKDRIFQSIGLTSNQDELISWIKSVQNGGGGDQAENYEQVLEYASQHVDWTEGSHRVLVVIGDAFPHEPEECLRQMRQFGLENPRAIDWKKETDQCWEKGIKIYGVRANLSTYTSSEINYFFESLAARTCGTKIDLDNFPMLTDMLLMVCFREADRAVFNNFRDEVEREGRMDEHRKEMFDKVGL